ncbi:hypothetical protein CIHG_09050 [Coccidioides immitis H538.4]|uniref:Uncharacterized protein n=1 Tax=Coccidioides immitis H538.4 TaxID=396776 RepID=A0A0J8UU19_COCIT|nr:hypothetical protein CIHG_09050 [Coccidioides immitis H538.4]
MEVKGRDRNLWEGRAGETRLSSYLICLVRNGGSGGQAENSLGIYEGSCGSKSPVGVTFVNPLKPLAALLLGTFTAASRKPVFRSGTLRFLASKLPCRKPSDYGVESTNNTAGIAIVVGLFLCLLVESAEQRDSVFLAACLKEEIVEA